MFEQPAPDCRAVNPQHLQILRIDKEGMIDDIITHSNDIICTINTCWLWLHEKDVTIVKYDQIGLLPTNHIIIIIIITMAYQSLWRLYES